MSLDYPLKWMGIPARKDNSENIFRKEGKTISGFEITPIDTKRFFEVLWRMCPSDRFVEIRHCRFRPDFSGRIERLFSPLSDLAEWTSYGLKLGESLPHNIHFSVLPKVKESGTKDSVEEFPVFWVDIDGCRTKKLFGDICSRPTEPKFVSLLREMGIGPNLAVDSGYGTHLYWVASEPFPVIEGEQVNRSLASVCTGGEGDSKFTGDIQASNAVHTLRFPGSCNCKAIPARKVTPFLLDKTPVESKKIRDFMNIFKTVASEPTHKYNSGKTRTALSNVNEEPLISKMNIRIESLSKCPFLDSAYRSPETLSYIGWFSLCAFFFKVFGDKGLNMFLEWSERDATRYRKSDAVSLWNSVVSRNMMPKNCSGLPESNGCKFLHEGKCKNLAWCVPVIADGKEKRT